MCRLAMIVELGLPAPLGAIGRIPPAQHYADLTTGENHGATNIRILRPEVFPLDAIAPHGLACHRPLRCSPEVLSTREKPNIVVPNRHVEDSRSGMNEEDVGRIKPSSREGQPLRGRVRVPKIPDLLAVHYL